MRFSAAFVLAAAGLVAAQSSTTSAAAAVTTIAPSGCGHAVDLIIQACLNTVEPRLNACGGNDWTCLCNNVQNVLTCYDNCPGDQQSVAIQQEKTSWCQAAAQFPASSSKVTAKATPTKTTSSGTSTGLQTGFASASGSSSASASPSSSGNAAAGLTPASGLLAAIFGLAFL